MRLLNLDASQWQNALDFYDGLLDTLRAPDWHGRNINALIDSIIYGDINEIEPPFRVTVIGLSHAGEAAKAALAEAFEALAEEGASYRRSDDGIVTLEIEWPLASNSRNLVN